MKIKTDVIRKIFTFLKNSNSLKKIDPYIFENIDNCREPGNSNFMEYYLEHIQTLPKLDFDTVIKISREVYQLYGKEKEFDEALKKLVDNNFIATGSLNEIDANCVAKVSESKILLSGTYYDVVMLCHEIGHKLRYDNKKNSSNMIDSFFFETPSIILELTANNYLIEKYGVDVDMFNLRKLHISNIKRNDNVENAIFQIVIKLLKDKKLNAINLYKEFAKNVDIIEHLNKTGISIEDCVDNRISSYSYDIGYILGGYAITSANKKEMLDMFLKYKSGMLETPFTIDKELISGTLGSLKYIKQ